MMTILMVIAGLYIPKIQAILTDAEIRDGAIGGMVLAQIALAAAQAVTQLPPAAVAIAAQAPKAAPAAKTALAKDITLSQAAAVIPQL
jgi:hypothetical protein